MIVKKEEPTSRTPALSPLAAMASFSNLTKHVDYEDFLEHLCLLMLSDKWVYTSPAVDALPTENNASDEKGEAVGEEKGEAVGEEKQESSEEVEDAVAASVEGKSEPEPEKPMPQVLQERLSLFLATYDQVGVQETPVLAA